MTDIIKQFFDERLYIETYPDVAEVGINPWEHFRRFGVGERRQFSRLVPPGEVEKRHGAYTTETIAVYLVEFLAKGGDEAGSKLKHAMQYGAGHPDCRVCEEIINRASMEKLDIAARKYQPLDLISFLCEKTNELAIDLDDHLSIVDYIRMYPDVSDAKVNAFFHYYIAGRTEGRRNRLSVNPGTAKEFDRLISQDFTKTPKSNTGDLDKLIARISDANTEKFYVFLSHDNPLQNLGGIQQVVASEFDLITEKDGSYLHIFPEISKASYDDNDDTDVAVGTIIDGIFCGFVRMSALIGVVKQEVKRIHQLRVHHLFGQNKSTLDLLSTLSVRSKEYIIHDHSFICNGYHLLRNNLDFCNAPPIESPDCTFCVHGESRRARSNLLSRLKSDGFEFSAPSQKVIEVSKKQKKNNISIKLNPHWNFQENKSNSVTSTRIVNVAYCGFDAFHKGYDLFLQTVLNSCSQKIKFHFFGAQRPVDLPSSVNYTEVRSPHLGAYAFKVELIRRDIHVVLMPSRCPETFGFIAHEAKAAGCVVIVSEKPHQPVSDVEIGGAVRSSKLNGITAVLAEECNRILMNGFARSTLAIQFQTNLRLNND